ncbi:hypothetical protein J6590_016616 [Homalodisca vitripennis]|nr:hypothetical protein J6590_016616 [Homalodisca vitripennis]
MDTYGLELNLILVGPNTLTFCILSDFEVYTPCEDTAAVADDLQALLLRPPLSPPSVDTRATTCGVMSSSTNTELGTAMGQWQCAVPGLRKMSIKVSTIKYFNGVCAIIAQLTDILNNSKFKIFVCQRYWRVYDPEINQFQSTQLPEVNSLKLRRYGSHQPESTSTGSEQNKIKTFHKFGSKRCGSRSY